MFELGLLSELFRYSVDNYGDRRGCLPRKVVIMCAVLYQLTCVNLMHVKRALRLISRASERHLAPVLMV